jgi:hypothetical protein
MGHTVTLPRAFLDISLYQVPGANGSAMTIPPGSVAPDFRVAAVHGIDGVFCRACNDIRPDPSYQLFIPAAADAGLQTGAYVYIRPPTGSALLHADRLLAQMDTCEATTLPPMVDMENFDGQADWAGNRYVDWVLELVDRLRAKDGRTPLGYGGKWFLDPMTGPRQHELVEAFQAIIVPAYPHQPAKLPQQQWPLPPVEPAGWETWARTTQGGDPGLPNGPTLPTGVTELDAWQFSSMGNTQHYGWATPHHLDLNVATEQAWTQWTEVPPAVSQILYPVGYGTDLVTMAEMRRRYEPKMEPEYARRLFSWLQAQGGLIGCGGGWRKVQPDKEGFAPPGKSFHQSQTFHDSTTWYCAIDLVARNPGRVHRSPTVAEGPQQGSAEATRWGVHCNVNGEPWHIQPVEIDGHDSWVKAGRPRPRAGYPGTKPGPPVHKPGPPPNTAEETEDMWFLSQWHDGSWWQINARLTERHGPIDAAIALHLIDTGTSHAPLPPELLPNIPIPEESST